MKGKAIITGDELDNLDFQTVSDTGEILRIANPTRTNIEIYRLERLNHSVQERYYIQDHYSVKKRISNEIISEKKLEKIGANVSLIDETFILAEFSNKDLTQQFTLKNLGKNKYQVTKFSLSQKVVNED